MRLGPLSLLVLALLCASPESAEASEVYKWYDDEGNLHISDSPPPKRAGVAVEKVSLQREPETEPDPVTTDWRGRYVGDQPSRMIFLENLGMDFSAGGSTRRRESIGTECGRGIDTRDAVRWAGRIPWQTAFHQRLDELGYQTPEAQRLSFKREEKKAPELSVIGVITDLRTSGCVVVSDLRIEWRIFDNLQRRTVFEHTTVSEGQGRPRSAASSLTRAFLEGAQQLIREPEFARLLTPGPGAASLDGSARDLPPLVVPFSFGPATGRFSDRVEELKQSTATVRTTTGWGSGFLLSSAGHVLTNEHVIRGHDRVVVELNDREHEATVLRRDAARDVAILEMQAGLIGASPLALARTRPRVGAPLYVIGTPIAEELHQSVSGGILSGTPEIDAKHYLQTDAAINHGNSGGPAFDERGEVIGIAVSGYAVNGAPLSINLLIPIDEVLETLRIESSH